MRRLLTLLGINAVLLGQSLTFAPQGSVAGTKKVETWAVSGCPNKAVSITVIYAIASQHGIPWITPKTAGEIFSKKSAWSKVVKGAGFLSAGGAIVTGSEWVKASPQWTYGFALGGGVLIALVPLAQKEVPQVDSAVGQALKLGSDGCGETSFYAYPSRVAGFNEAMYR